MAAEPPDFRLGEMVSFMVTRDRLSAKSLVFLNLEFQKPANVGTWATPPENTEAQEQTYRNRAPESCILALLAEEGAGGEQ